MEPTANPFDIIQYIQTPAFIVNEDDVIIKTNDTAGRLGIKTGISVTSLITHGLDDYRHLTSGKLLIQLSIGQAWISIIEKQRVFCLEDRYPSPALRAFALVAQNLRSPLSNALSGTELLLQTESLQEDISLRQKLGEINRALYQMIRAISNMSDVTDMCSSFKTHFSIHDVTAIFDDFFEKAAKLVKSSNRILKFTNLKQELHLNVDPDLLERLFLNLISNAIKFSPEKSEIKVSLKKTDNRFSLIVENNILDGHTGVYGQAFSRFLREPGIESSKYGLGLGMLVISTVVSAHHGTVLMRSTPKTGVKITVTIPTRTSTTLQVKTPISFVEGYTGGIDNYLVELSDVLPSRYYEFP